MKGNQKLLVESCKQTAQNEQPIDTSISTTRGHGRKEERTAQVFNTFSWFSASTRHQWGNYIKAVIKVTRKRKHFSAENKRWKQTTQEAYYIATTMLSAQKANRFIRAHWGIENKSHYVRDVTMREDMSRIRTHPDRMVRVRSFAFNILRDNGEKNISRAQHENSLSLEKMLKYRGFEL